MACTVHGGLGMMSGERWNIVVLSHGLHGVVVDDFRHRSEGVRVSRVNRGLGPRAGCPVDPRQPNTMVVMLKQVLGGRTFIPCALEGRLDSDGCSSEVGLVEQ